METSQGYLARQSRQVEEVLTEIVLARCSSEEDLPELVVSAVSDEQKGEKLVVLHTALPLSVQEILEEAAETDLPSLLPERVAGHRYRGWTYI